MSHFSPVVIEKSICNEKLRGCNWENEEKMLIYIFLLNIRGFGCLIQHFTTKWTTWGCSKGLTTLNINLFFCISASVWQHICQTAAVAAAHRLMFHHFLRRDYSAQTGRTASSAPALDASPLLFKSLKNPRERPEYIQRHHHRVQELPHRGAIPHPLHLARSASTRPSTSTLLLPQQKRAHAGQGAHIWIVETDVPRCSAGSLGKHSVQCIFHEALDGRIIHAGLLCRVVWETERWTMGSWHSDGELGIAGVHKSSRAFTGGVHS